MNDWKSRRVWLKDLNWDAPEETKTPAETAAYELKKFFADDSGKVEICLEEALGEGYALSQTAAGYKIHGGKRAFCTALML